MNAKGLQPYSSLDMLVRQHRVVLPRPKDGWRLVMDPIGGQINGLPAIAGKTVATNGIIVALETPSGDLLFGHLEWFVPNDDEVGAQFSDLYDNAPRKASGNKQSARQRKLIEAYAIIA